MRRGSSSFRVLKEKQPVACRIEGKEAGRVDQWLRMFAVLAEGPVNSKHLQWLVNIHNSRSRGSDVFF